MTQVNAMKNPVLRNKMGMEVTIAAGNVFEEISEQDMNAATGGTFGLSAYLGNKGYVCTLTFECQGMCK